MFRWQWHKLRIDYEYRLLDSLDVDHMKDRFFLLKAPKNYIGGVHISDYLNLLVYKPKCCPSFEAYLELLEG